MLLTHEWFQSVHIRWPRVLLRFEPSIFAPREASINHGGNLVVNLNTRQNEEVTRTPTFAAIAAFAVVAVVAVVASVLQPDVTASNLGAPEAVASPRAPFVPYPVVSAEEYRAFILQGHERAAREGDPAPLHATF